jgi:hypothetical protein
VALADHDGDDSHARGIEGTWRVQVTLRDCNTGAALGNPFNSLLTFAQGGTLVETTSNPMFAPAERGPGHGVWSRVGRHSYTAASIAFITVNSALVRVQTIRQTIQIDDNGNQLTADAKTEFTDAAGNPLPSGCATATGERFE